MLRKGFKTNWSKKVYTVSRVRKPKDDSRPHIYFVVDEKGTPFKQPKGKEAQMLTIKDMLLLPKDRDGKPMPVKKPPSDLRDAAEDEWKTAVSSDEEDPSDDESADASDDDSADEIPVFDPEVPKQKEKEKEKNEGNKKNDHTLTLDARCVVSECQEQRPKPKAPFTSERQPLGQCQKLTSISNGTTAMRKSDTNTGKFTTGRTY